MVFHQVQCPSCFTEYAISDNQYQASGGLIRCGTCRGQYKAILLGESEEKAEFDPRKVFIEPFSGPLRPADGGSTDIDINSEEPEPSYLDYAKSVDPDEEPIELLSSHQFEHQSSEEPTEALTKESPHSSTKESTQEPLIEPSEESNALDSNSEPYANSDELSTSEILRNLRGKSSANSGSRTSSTASPETPPNQDLKPPEEPTPYTIDLFADTEDAGEEKPQKIDDDLISKPELLETNEDSRSAADEKLTETPFVEPLSTEAPEKSTLIDQVDQLVDEKLIGSSAIDLSSESKNDIDLKIHAKNANSSNQAKSEKADQNKKPDDIKRKKSDSTKRQQTKGLKKTPAADIIVDDFFLDSRQPKVAKKNIVIRFIQFVLGFTVLLVLAVVLAYQLWLKQFIELPRDITWLEHPQVQKLQDMMGPYFELTKQQLANHDITLPKRRNLSQLDLVSAQTEPHPSRPTTVLLRVSLINRAKIAQSLPWLEMSLTDSDGRLVARRNLSPGDYIYKNRTNDKIGSNELKKITIELLSFPKSATGYEIKLLNN